MSSYKLVNGASIEGLDIRMRPAMIVCGRVFKKHKQTHTITCGLNGSHSSGSLHPYGLAIDSRTRFLGWSWVKKRAVRDEIAIALSRIDYRFDVILHKTHLHIEFDINKKEVTK